MKKLKNNIFLMASSIALLVLAIAIFSNYNSFNYAKESCFDNNKTPKNRARYLCN